MGKLFIKGVGKVGIGIGLIIIGWELRKAYSAIPEDCECDYDEGDDWSVEDADEGKDAVMYEDE